jgi:MFS family permease
VSAPPTPPGGERSESQRGEVPHNIAAAITDVSERATLLVREEIELAKAEVSEKATKLIRGAIVGIAAGVFVLTAVIFALIGCAFLLYFLLPGNDWTFFWGFFAMAVILLLLGALAGLLAAKAVKRGSPPTPSMAIEEAQKIRQTVSKGADSPAAAPATGSPSAGAGVSG